MKTLTEQIEDQVRLPSISKPEKREVRTLTRFQWEEEGNALFGKDKGAWRFVCPKCRTVTTAWEWVDAGADASDFAYYCIGRFVEGRGCYFTLGDSSKMHTLEIDGVPFFEFAEKGTE